jgi:Inward rectifier potassium channel C-terminal domain
MGRSTRNESTGAQTTARADYANSDVHWNATFRDVLMEDADGALHIEYTNFDEVEPFLEAPRNV